VSTISAVCVCLNACCSAFDSGSGFEFGVALGVAVALVVGVALDFDFN
jgi:hypothetical protein